MAGELLGEENRSFLNTWPLVDFQCSNVWPHLTHIWAAPREKQKQKRKKKRHTHTNSEEALLQGLKEKVED